MAAGASRNRAARSMGPYPRRRVTYSAPAPDRDTIGKYELLLELGRGGMAVLYLARARGVGGFTRLFAIKRILPHLAADPAFVEMFLDEGRIAARLSHPNLCSVFELGHDGRELFLVMEYLDGVPWEALAAAAHDPGRVALGADRRLGLAAGVFAQACEGLHHAHTLRDVDGTAMPIVHRDVSPQNLFVSIDGTCRVLDFGVSKIATDHRRTRTGVRKGKLPYMAPEQIRRERVDGSADLWAIGAMLWEALTGARLFDRDTDFLIYEAITGMPIPSVNAARAPDAGAGPYPEAVDRIIARALARDRDQRYATARDLARDLLQLAADLAAPASRDAIAQAVAGLCGDQLVARKQAIASAIAQRSAAEAAAAAPRAAATEPGRGSAASPGPAGEADAAETVSMAMRRDAIVVEHRRRRRWLAPLAGIAAITAVAAGILAWRGGPASDAPFAPAAARPGPSSTSVASSDPARTGSTSRPGTAPGLVAGEDSRSARDVSSASSARGSSAEPSTSGPRTGSPRTVADSDARRPATAGSTSEPTSAGVRRASSPTTSPPSSDGRRGASVVDRARSSDRSSRSASASSPAARPPPVSPARLAHDTDRAPSAALRDRDAHPASAPSTASATGWYAIDSAPYATIFVDDRQIGDTPLDRIPLPAGSHRVRAVLADGRQRTFAIDIAADRKTSSGTLAW
ncbi:MAG: hypothetical protein E6J91_48660 [Deltaproteobacteria bacterium]|nr:MAG: hypothetical protein E6J91_48660 [Deltaproteobacteria bacterium]